MHAFILILLIDIVALEVFAGPLDGASRLANHVWMHDLKQDQDRYRRTLRQRTPSESRDLTARFHNERDHQRQLLEQLDRQQRMKSSLNPPINPLPLNAQRLEFQLQRNTWPVIRHWED